jgi:hypothetical protein
MTIFELYNHLCIVLVLLIVYGFALALSAGAAPGENEPSGAPRVSDL